MVSELEEEFYETNRTKLLRWFPWLHLFRAFRIALDVRKLCLGAVAAFLLALGSEWIDALPFAPDDAPRAPLIVWPWSHSLIAAADVPLRESPLQRQVLWLRVLLPLQTVIEPGWMLFRTGNTWADVAYAWTRLLFALALWSLLGGAIARIAAVQFATRQGLTTRSAVSYALAHFASAFGAPLLPLVFIAFLWLVAAAIGLVGRLPAVGPVIAGALWFLPLLVGLALAVILLVIAVGWPLMIATISAEGTDAFDGLSRAYDYLLNRTWYALWLVALTVFYGAAVIFLVSAVAHAGVHLAWWGAGSGLGDQSLSELMPADPPDLLADPSGIDPRTATVGGALATGWVRILSWFVWGFVISFFWTAVTIMYFLLRLSLDAKPLDDVYIPSGRAAPEELPLVGMPAAERRQEQRGEQEAAGSATPPDVGGG